MMDIIKRDGKIYVNQDWIEKIRDNSGYGLPIGYDEYIERMFSKKEEENSEMS